MPSNPTIYLNNQSTTPVDQWLPAGKSLSDVAAALTKQVQRDFAPAWGEGFFATVKVYDPNGGPMPPGGWSMLILDKSDEQDALGYHDVDAAGNPILKVFVQDTLAAKESVTVDMSHELLETLGDAYCNLCAASSRTRKVYAYENCDAVEETTYEIDGITVSNFVFPEYFEDVELPAGAPPRKLDFLGLVKTPFELLPGGYLSFFRAGKWKEEFGSEQARERHAKRTKHRKAIRAKRHSHSEAAELAA